MNYIYTNDAVETALQLSSYTCHDLNNNEQI